MKTITHVLTLEVTVPYCIKAETVENAINRALDEPPNVWDDWFVGGVTVTESRINESETE